MNFLSSFATFLLSRRFLLWGAPIIAMVVALVSVPIRDYQEYLGGFVARRISGPNHTVALTNPSVLLVGLKANTAQILVSTPPLSLDVANPTLRVSLLQLGLGRVVTTLSGNLLEGEVVATAASSLLSGLTTVSLDASNVNIYRHPYLTLLGFTDGKVSLKSDGLAFTEAQEIPQGSLSVALTDLASPGKGTLLQGALQALVSAYAPNPELAKLAILPQFRGVALQTELKFLDNTLTISGLRLSLPIGTLQGEGVVKGLNMPPSQQLVALNLQARIDDASLRSVGPLLPLISGNRLTELHKAFTLEIAGSIAQPKVVIDPNIHPSPTSGHRNSRGDPATAIARKPKGNMKIKDINTDDKGPEPTIAPPG